MHDLSRCLIAYEAREKHPSAPPAFLVCEKLRPNLANLMGSAGFCALLSRALTVARSENVWLLAVQVDAHGTLGVSEGVTTGFDPIETTEGGIVLVAHLLGLLAAFIGDSLTLRLVRDIWPKLPLADSNFTKGDHL